VTYQLDPLPDVGTRPPGPEADLIDAVLEGGPVTFPDDLRMHRVSRSEQKVKIPHYGGHEHFERDPDLDGPPEPGAPVVFRWTTRTRVAE
jgi:hypothetical protein